MKEKEQTFFCIRPQFFRRRRAIKKIIEDKGFNIIQTKVVWLNKLDVGMLYGHEEPSPYFNASLEYMTCGFSEVGVIEGEDVIAKFSDLTGDIHISKECKIGTLRHTFGPKKPVLYKGFNYFLNPLHRSRTKEESERELKLFQMLVSRPTTVIVSDMIEKLHKDKNLQCVFENHIKKVVAFGINLCERFGGNREIVELSCWLHDIASLKTGVKHEHQIVGAQDAKRILSKLGCNNELILHVQECIQSHRGSVLLRHLSKESEIVCAADGLANLSYPPLLFFFAFGIKNLGFEDGIESINKKVKSSFKKIPEFAKPDAAPYLDWWKKLE